MSREEPRMATTRFDVHAAPAYLKQVLGKDHCEVWLSQQAAKTYDRVRFATLHLDLTPTKAAAAKVELDDHADDGGLTTLDDRVAVGAVYLTEALWQEHSERGLIEPAPRGEEACQTQARVYIDRKAGSPEVVRRYYGFVAKLQKLDGRFAAFAVYQHSDALGGPGRQLWIDRDDRAQCDDVELAPSPKPGDQVALFLSWDFAGANGLSAAKIPRGLGAGRRFGGGDQ